MGIRFENKITGRTEPGKPKPPQEASPKENKMTQEEMDEAAEYEMADRTHGGKSGQEQGENKMTQEEMDEAAEYEMADRTHGKKESDQEKGKQEPGNEPGTTAESNKNIKADSAEKGHDENTKETAEPGKTEAAAKEKPVSPEQEVGRKSPEQVANERAEIIAQKARETLDKMKYLLAPDELLKRGAQAVGRAGAELASKTVQKIEKGIDAVADKVAEKCKGLWERCAQAQDRLFGRIRAAKNKFFDATFNMTLKAIDSVLALDELGFAKSSGRSEIRQAKAEYKLKKRQIKEKGAVLFKGRARDQVEYRKERLANAREQAISKKAYLDQVREQRERINQMLRPGREKEAYAESTA